MFFMVLGKPTGAIRSDVKDSFIHYNLRQARINAGLTMKALGKKIGISLAGVSVYERLRGFPTSEKRERIASILGKKVNELFPEGFEEIVRYAQLQRNGKYKKDSLDNAGPLNNRLGEEPIDTSLDNSGMALRESEEARVKIVESVQQALQSAPLTDRERDVIKMKYGIGYDHNYTLGEIHSLIGVTKSRVGQIVNDALDKLRRPRIKSKLELAYAEK